MELDLFARKIVGWAMSETMLQELTLAALRVALGWRDPDPGLVHHSDRGSQYAAHDYRNVLKARGIPVSMSRKGDCWDNNRRGGKRRSFTWARYPQVLDFVAIARPRITEISRRRVMA